MQQTTNLQANQSLAYLIQRGVVWTSSAHSFGLSFPWANISEFGNANIKKAERSMAPKLSEIDSSWIPNLRTPAWCIIMGSDDFFFVFYLARHSIVQCWHRKFSNLLHFCDSTVCLAHPELSWNMKLNCWQSRTRQKKWSENQIRECGRLGNTIRAGWAKLIKNKNKIIQNLTLSLKIGGDKCNLKSHKTCSPTQCSPFCWFNF